MNLFRIARVLSAFGFFACFSALAADTPIANPAEIIIYNARVLTVNSNFTIAQAIAIRGNQIIAVGKDKQVQKLKGLNTRLIDAQGRIVMPGIYDGDVCSYQAAVSDLDNVVPDFQSLGELHDYIVKQVAEKPTNSWIVLDHIYPTRLQEHRLPTLDELDGAAPNNPVILKCESYALVNSKAMALAKITRETPSPFGGEIVHAPKTLVPTGLLLRSAVSLVKVPAAKSPARAARRTALKNLYRLYNEKGITSVAEHSASQDAIALFRDLNRSNELTVRINCGRSVELAATPEESITNLNTLTNVAKGKPAFGISGAGDDWVRLGALDIAVDGEVAFGSAYLRTPYGIGPTFLITEPAYRGVVHVDHEIFPDFYREAALRGWQLSGRAQGDAAADTILNTFRYAGFKTNITESRFIVNQSVFFPAEDWSQCRQLGVGLRVEPALLYRDGFVLTKVLGEKRMRGYLPLKSAFENNVIVGAGSGHHARLDCLDSNPPWNPWFGMWTAITRQTDQITFVNPDECLTREQAVRLYTFNNAWLANEESVKGSLEPGKLADLIVLDRNILTCPANDVKDTKVLLTMLNGNIVWEQK